MSLRASFDRSLGKSRGARDGSDSLDRASAHRVIAAVRRGKIWQLFCCAQSESSITTDHFNRIDHEHFISIVEQIHAFTWTVVRTFAIRKRHDAYSIRGWTNRFSSVRAWIKWLEETQHHQDCSKYASRGRQAPFESICFHEMFLTVAVSLMRHYQRRDFGTRWKSRLWTYHSTSG